MREDLTLMKIISIVLGIIFLATVADAQIYQMAEMNAAQLRALDKSKTAVIIPGGIMEQHDDLLPAGTDTLMNEWWAQRLAEAIVARAGWKALIFPTVPLGTSGANDLGGKFSFPGSYTVRPETERQVFMDLASALGEQNFKWIFVVHNHGAPRHNLMLDQAGDFFRDTYGGKMVNLAGLLPKNENPAPFRSAEVLKEEGAFEVHAGMSETSRILFLRPDLVSLNYLTAKPFTANTPAEAAALAKTNDWRGYIGSPRLATAAYGAQMMQYQADQYNRLALAILDGLDERTVTRFSDVAQGDKTITAIEDAAQKHNAEIERKQADWLKKKGIR
jgi:creatinine amidohydrolase/Fe(II)-dependent formamide hydrolase-like protein